MYATIIDLTKLLSVEDLLLLASPVRGATLDDTDVQEAVAKAIEQAESEVDGYVGARHAVPLSVVPDLIQSLTSRMAIRNLTTRRRRSGPDEVWEKDYDRCIRILERISDGRMPLGPAADQQTAPERRVKVCSPKRMFAGLRGEF